MRVTARQPMLVAATFIVLGVSGISALSAQEPDAAVRAAGLLAAEQYDAAAEAYRSLVAARPDDAGAWLQLGVALEHLGRSAAASDAFGHAADAGMGGLRPLVHAATNAARSGDADRAFAWLHRAVEAGLPDRFLRSNEELAPLRSDARFAPLLDRAERLSHPCRFQPQYRQLDFWLGDWDVYIGDALVGHNTITAEEDGCVLEEHWRSVRGGTGRSFSYFDPGSGGWRQLWVSAGGDVLTARGGMANGAMHLLGERVTASGVRTAHRMTYTPNDDGSVRQLLEESSDGGATWQVWFDGRYVRPSPAP